MNPGTPVLTWSTARLPPPRRFDAFRDMVNATHLPWDLPMQRGRPAYRARLRPQGSLVLKLVECACDPCTGRRGAHETGSADEAWFGVLHLLSGQERLRQAGREAFVGDGDLVLWDSTRPIDFAIGRPLHKITLLLPQTLVETAAPAIHDRVCRPVSGRDGAGAVLANHLRMLAATAASFSATQLGHATSATLELLSLVWGAPHQPRSYASVLEQVRMHALARLGDPTLTVGSLARDAGLSLRQLHRVFEDEGATPGRWLWLQRLERCRTDLASRPDMSVSEIAFRWGFSDAAHFSRAFRRRFGLSPREWRRRSLPR